MRYFLFLSQWQHNEWEKKVVVILALWLRNYILQFLYILWLKIEDGEKLNLSYISILLIGPFKIVLTESNICNKLRKLLYLNFDANQLAL